MFFDMESHSKRLRVHVVAQGHFQKVMSQAPKPHFSVNDTDDAHLRCIHVRQSSGPVDVTERGVMTPRENKLFAWDASRSLGNVCLLHTVTNDSCEVSARVGFPHLVYKCLYREGAWCP